MQPLAIARREEGPVDSEIASERSYSVGDRGLRCRMLPLDRSAGRAEFRLSRGSSLIVISLLSIGLWAVVWAAVGSVAGLWLR
jgi:hypothetical protein